MFQHMWVAQAAIPVESSTLAFLSGSQFFIALIAGVAMAFAFQLVLTNLSVAAGISGAADALDSDADGWGKKIRRVEAKVGTGTILIVNTALFTACFLAVKLTLIHESTLGAIVGVVIWSVYFLLLFWTSSRAVGSLLGAVGSTASSGLQGVAATMATALSGQAATSQIANTVEASVGAVRKELQSVLEPDRLRENLQDYVTKLQLPQADFKDISSQVLGLLENSNLQSVASSVTNATTDAATNLTATPDLLSLVQSATPEELKSGKLRERLTDLIGNGLLGNGQGNGGSQEKQGGSLRDRALQLGLGSLVSTLARRVDLSDLDIEKITEQLSSFQQKVGEQAGQAIGAVSQVRSFSPIRTDIENYLLNSPFWYLSPEGLDRGFREALYDPNADARAVRQQLEPINRSYFVEVLTRRDGITPEQVNDIADEVEVIRQEVLDTVRAAEAQERSQELRQQVETYLSSAPKEALSAERIQQDFTALLADPEASYETLGNRLLQFDRDTLMQMLMAGRQDLSQEEAEQIRSELMNVRDRFLNESEETWNQLQSQASGFRQQVESYLRETNPADFTPDAIQQTLQRLLNAPEAGSQALQTGLGQLNRDTLRQVLSQRQDINPEQVDQLLDQFESVRDRLLHAPQQLTEQARAQVDQLTNQIADYLRNTNLEELDPKGIQRDLQTLLNDPQTGAYVLRQRLSQVDRETLVKLVSQGSDLNEEQVNQTIDKAQEAIRQIVRAPQRLATRTRDRLRDFPTELSDYLRHTNREELNPEGIKRDLQLLIKQPRAGVEQLGDRLGQVDRETIVALLSEREDISEEDANRIVDQVLGQIQSVRDQVTQQAQKVQDRVQSLTSSVTDRVRTYLNALDQPELNYEGIQRDVRKLFDDPEAGFDALRDRLSHFDRETLVSILSSRKDISEEQANRIVDQIESARDNVLHRAERLQQEAEKQIKAVKHEAKEQAKEVQKTVATAAWWLFGTAITSVATAAIAGILASSGFNFPG
uniref:MFS transporter n=1 Tax=Trichocoleus desertorum TaxID=1481672 RepID=UPI0025B3D66E|nr:MFS transporter [Trichocoleus desertorum]